MRQSSSLYKKFDHPYCLKFVESFGISDDHKTVDCPVIVTNFFEGKQLRVYIEDKIKNKLHYKEVMLNLMLKCATAVEYLHTKL